jgi:hypothetical protein
MSVLTLAKLSCLRLECQHQITTAETKMDTEQLRAALQDRVIKRVAKAAGINYWTLLRFASGERTPRAVTLDKLREYFRGDL